ncbi:hypothetical protein [Paraburkholderia bonniea]|nr:hypothetical protein [Paraburkholderia bonniea]
MRATVIQLIRAYGYKLTQAPFNLERALIFKLASEKTVEADFDNLLKLGPVLIAANFPAQTLIEILLENDGLKHFQYLADWHVPLGNLNYSSADMLKILRLPKYENRVNLILNGKFAAGSVQSEALVNSQNFLWCSETFLTEELENDASLVPVSATDLSDVALAEIYLDQEGLRSLASSEPDLSHNNAMTGSEVPHLPAFEQFSALDLDQTTSNPFYIFDWQEPI